MSLYSKRVGNDYIIIHICTCLSAKWILFQTSSIIFIWIHFKLLYHLESLYHLIFESFITLILLKRANDLINCLYSFMLQIHIECSFLGTNHILINVQRDESWSIHSNYIWKRKKIIYWRIIYIKRVSFQLEWKYTINALQSTWCWKIIIFYRLKEKKRKNSGEKKK